MTIKKIPNDLFFGNIKNLIDQGNCVELKIKGTSMHPTLLDGKHKVVLVPVQKERLQTGIIALFTYKGKYILHRLVSIKENLLVFQGDNLLYTKEYVKREDIIAVVEFIIEPTGKVRDCKKRYFFIKNRLCRLIHQYHLIFAEKIRMLFLKKTIPEIKDNPS